MPEVATLPLADAVDTNGFADTAAACAPALELRVLAGPQAGARTELRAHRPCVVAVGGDAEVEADVVLRDAAATPTRVRITARDDDALLEVLAGEVLLHDRAYGEGDVLRWQAHAALGVGACSLAFGEASAGEWPATDPEPVAEPDHGPAADAGDVESHDQPRSGRLSWLVAIGAAVVLATAGALGLAWVISAPRTPPASPTLAAALKASEFASLEVVDDGRGHAQLRGRLATLAQRTRLDAWLSARGEPPPAIDVRVDEGLLRDVVDVFRVNGVAVQAKLQGPGQVSAEASEPDAQRLARAEEVVRRDVRGLDKLSVVNKAVPVPPPRPPVADDPGKRIASVVPGEPAYLVTADGSRYFVGAMLPTGHRITQISGQRVTLERDGQSSTLVF